ncbi:MAG: PAS domain-containing protein [Candidatus Fermentibacteraceae bacterium]|nr:PAS domain-containing protein [Candidatus Fermentibacteraceae bacterium]MBN2607948.1 PAS domain-containing protein [Candidatus Fermentibacteraceae bacterium]
MMDGFRDITTILDAVSDAVVLADGDGMVSYMNPEAERLTGRSAGKDLGKDLWEVCTLVERNTRRPMYEGMDEVLRKDGFFHFPGATVLVPSGGDDVLVSGTVFLSRGGDRNADSIEGVVFRDVSARWLLDRSLRNSQKSDAMKVLARGIAGNVNDLLTVLLARLSGISREHGDRGAVLRHVRESRKLIGRISGMITSLTADPGSSGKADVCQSGKVIRSSSMMFASAYPDVELELAYPDRTGFAGIPVGLFEQVLVNLLMNAGQAAGDGGRVTLTACRVLLRNDTPQVSGGDYVMITVSDNGSGIPDDDLTRIFDPFFSTGRNRYGLGLSAVYSIVNGCGGYVTVDSELGRGSVFTVYLPAAEGIESETEGDAVPAVMIKGIEGTMREEIAGILHSIGCEVDGEPGSTGCLLVVTDYDHYMFEGESWEGPGSPVNGSVVLVDESLRSPSDSGPRVVFVGLPVKLDTVASAVVRLAWKRSISCSGGVSE